MHEGDEHDYLGMIMTHDREQGNPKDQYGKVY